MALGALGALLLKFKALLLPVLKFLPILLKTGGSMFLTIGLYAMAWGWWWALGFVLLIFVHECGHLLAARRVGLKVGALCEGGAHVYIHTGNRTHVWDTCGPEAILREAGGRMTDISNEPLEYRAHAVQNPNGLIATNGVIHDRVVQVVQSVLESFR